MCEMYATRCASSAGACTRTEIGSIVSATPPPSDVLIDSASRAAVVKSGVCRFSTSESAVPSVEGTVRSTVAPFGTRPVLGTFTDTREPSSPSMPNPPTTRLPCASA